ncbi:MAG: response regulator [Methanomassiliicoccales archaeon]
MSLILPIRVLVVDDEPYLCELSKEFLEQSEDMKVETSDSVSKAMMALEQGHFDVIVSDYQMPVENGIQFLKSLGGDGNQIPFILFTGRGREEVVIEALNNGADSYLQKGGKPESQYVELEHRIRSAVQRFQAEESLRRLNRNLRAISECNRAMIRAKDEQTLFSDICNIICNVAGYRMAWIGMAEQDEAKSVSVSAWSGFEQVYLAQARITWADTERGRGPTGRAIRTGQTVFIQDYRTDASIMPWLATATERGYHSSIAIPLKEEDDVFGALMIYSEQICGFDEEELALLKDMTMDLSFGIISLRDREKRKRAEERLLQTSDRLSLATRAGGVGIWDFDVINNKLTWDGQMFKLYGIKEEQFGGAYEAWKAGLFPEDAERGDEETQMALRGEKEYDTEFRVLWPDGTVHHIRALALVQRDASGRALRMVGTNWDITAGKQMEEALHESNRRLNLLSNVTRHDLVNQLLVLQRQLALLKRERLRSPSSEPLQRAEAAAERISATIEFTKEYEDIGIKAPIWVSPGCQMVDVFASLHPVGVTLLDEICDIEIFADPLSVKLPYNLLDNSMRHGERVTHIKLSTQQRGDAMLIVYEDDGVGISEEDKKRLFERGFGKNTGFGLFLAREILAITGITITENGKAGVGVRFEIMVPSGAWRLPSPR